MKSTNNLNRYTIMHGNRKVACIHKNGSCVIYSRKFMPYNLWLEKADTGDVDTRVNNLQNFYYWCSSRTLTLDRKYAKEILNALGKKQAVTDRDRAEIAISYHCLSLMDIYWVKGYREQASFEEINLFEHSLSDAFVDVCLRGDSITLQNSAMLRPNDVAGDLATVGIAPKAWVRRDGEFYLYKDGEARDVEAELLASKVLDCFEVEHVRYVETEYKGQNVSACKLISSKQRSIVAAEFVEIYAINNECDFGRIVENEFAYEYHMMNIMDYLVGNSDRHWGNWGFYVDNNTNKLLGLHPLMDFNKAFENYADMSGGKCLTDNAGITQQEAAAIGVKTVGLNQKSEVKKEWFRDESQWQMFNARLEYLMSQQNEISHQN